MTQAEEEAYIDFFAACLKVKLAHSRHKGKTGWWSDGAYTEEVCQKQILDHVAKGDPRDVALLAMFAHYHNWSTGV